MDVRDGGEGEVGGAESADGSVESDSLVEFLLELGRGSRIERVAVVQSAADEGMGDRASGFGGDPSEDLAKRAEGVEAGR
ncbi:hypothetical protein NDU88_012294 [Pleurodeles waltl]|uniref:Uncharacterized protein n=1 Tax=Pleurodeles waltl TaxID=8319 RepID=A0AAV7R2U7_PLEWA|nr:hypothetical protein NDU88_012294 [Pleurodeles waltl]